jgi:hypothetical protein
LKHISTSINTGRYIFYIIMAVWNEKRCRVYETVRECVSFLPMCFFHLTPALASDCECVVKDEERKRTSWCVG